MISEKDINYNWNIIYCMKLIIQLVQKEVGPIIGLQWIDPYYGFHTMDFILWIPVVERAFSFNAHN